MKVILVENRDTDYHLQFEEQQEDKITRVKVSFQSAWRLVKESEDVRETIGFFQDGEEQDFPYELKEVFKTIPTHIPHEWGREIFKACFEYFVRISKAPIHVSFTHHPGYPLTLVTYNPGIISEQAVREISHSIAEAIKKAHLEYEDYPEEKEQSSEDDDSVDEDIILDYEEDPELKALMKEPSSTEYLPLKGE